jgi:hypothetical protein
MAFACLLFSGCAWLSGDVLIHQSPQGSVFLERVIARGSTAMYRPASKSFEATHPARVDPDVIARVLRGVHVQDQAGKRLTSSSSLPQTVPAFTEEDVAFLAPLLSTALSQAAPDQRVRFHVIHSSSSGDETTDGTLYVNRPLLHLALTHIRQNPERSDEAALDQQAILFSPDAARRPDAEVHSPSLFGKAQPAILAIDYQLLSKLPAPQAIAPSSPTTHAETAQEETRGSTPAPLSASTNQTRTVTGDSRTLEELRTVKEHALKKDIENEALKEEVRALRQQLADQEAELNRLKKEKIKKKSSQGNQIK